MSHPCQRLAFESLALALTLGAAHPSAAAAQEPPATFLWARAEWSDVPQPFNADYAFRVTAMPNGDSVTIGQHRYPITFGAGEPNEALLTLPTTPGPYDAGGMYLVRHAPDGSVVWAQTIKAGNGILPLNVRGFPDGSVLAVAAYGGPVTFDVNGASPLILPEDPSFTYNGFVARFHADGTLDWTRRVDGNPIGAATFADGSFAICGSMSGVVTFGEAPNQVALAATGETAFVAKYEPDGSLAWARVAENVLVSGSFTNSLAWGVAGLSDGSCVIAGAFGAGIGAGNGVTLGAGQGNAATLISAGEADAFVARYAADGTFLWARAAGSPAYDYFEDLAAGSDDSVVITGSGAYYGPPGGIAFEPGGGPPVTLASGQTFFAARYDSAGDLAWAKGATSASGWGVSAFPDGSWVVTGGRSGEPPVVFGAAEATLPAEGQGFAARYFADGALAWAVPCFLAQQLNIYGGGGFAQGVAAFPDGTFFAVGNLTLGAVFGSGQAGELAVAGAPFVVMDPSLGSSYYPATMWFARYRAFAANTAPVGPDATTAEVVATTPGGDPTAIELAFDEVLSPGVTTVTAASSGEGLPTGFQLGGEPVWYDVSTSATFSGPIALCFSWSEGQFANEANVALLHYEGGQWVDTTTSLDTEANVVCGLVSSLSPFVVAEVEYVFGGIEQPVAPDGSSIFRRGRVVPLKFQLFGPTGAPVVDAEATLRLYHISQSVLGTVEVMVGSAGEANSGNEFRYDEPTGRYVYNLATSPLATGTYRADVLLDDGSTHSVQLSLR